jgi:hypothetical protein
MRRLLSISASLAVLASIAVYAQTGAKTAQAPASASKLTASWKCPPPNPMNSIPVGDDPGHAYVVDQGKCTATKGEIEGVKEAEGTATEFMEVKGSTGKGHGVFIESLANGDKITYSYDFTATMANNMPQGGSNKWTITGGTGKFKGIKGSGTCTGKGNPDGSANYDCAGTYTMAK